MPIYELEYDAEKGEHVDEDGKGIGDLMSESEVRVNVRYYAHGMKERVVTEYQEGDGEEEEVYTCKHEDCERVFGTERGMKTHYGQSHDD